MYIINIYAFYHRFLCLIFSQSFFFFNICFFGYNWVIYFFLLFLISFDNNISIFIGLCKEPTLGIMHYFYLFISILHFLYFFFLTYEFLPLIFFMAILFLLLLYLNLDAQLIFVHSSLIIKAFNFPGISFNHVPYILMCVVVTVIIKQSMTRVLICSWRQTLFRKSFSQFVT